MREDTPSSTNHESASHIKRGPLEFRKGMSYRKYFSNSATYKQFKTVNRILYRNFPEFNITERIVIFYKYVLKKGRRIISRWTGFSERQLRIIDDNLKEAGGVLDSITIYEMFTGDGGTRERLNFTAIPFFRRVEDSNIAKEDREKAYTMGQYRQSINKYLTEEQIECVQQSFDRQRTLRNTEVSIDKKHLPTFNRLRGPSGDAVSDPLDVLLSWLEDGRSRAK